MIKADLAIWPQEEEHVSRKWLLKSVIAGVLALSGGQVLAQSKTVAAGKSVSIWFAWNCRTGATPGLSGTATNGTLTTETTTANRCNNASQPVTRLMYTPKPGFRGTDTVYIYGPGAPAGTQVTVTVK